MKRQNFASQTNSALEANIKKKDTVWKSSKECKGSRGKNQKRKVNWVSNICLFSLSVACIDFKVKGDVSCISIQLYHHRIQYWGASSKFDGSKFHRWLSSKCLEFIQILLTVKTLKNPDIPSLLSNIGAIWFSSKTTFDKFHVRVKAKLL